MRAVNRKVLTHFDFRAVALLLAGASLPASAQQDTARPPTDTGARTITAVRVTVTHDAARSPLDVPFAITRLTPDSVRPGLRRSGVAELLFAVPGVQVQDRANPSQDPRIVVRGFGGRAAFGTRGVRVLRDGIPLTLPDGQTPLDWLDLESIGSIDIVRGTAAALYGNAAGGVVNFRSREITAKPLALEARVWDGGGQQRATVQAEGSVSPVSGWQGSFTRTAGDGPRRWSRLEATSGFARAHTTFRNTRLEAQGILYDAPRADNTGALTAAELARDPQLPDSLNVTRRSRKAVRQSQFALLAGRGAGDNVFEASLFTGTRALDNPLAFAIVNVDRRTSGGSLRGAWRTTRTPWPIRLGAGADVQHQVDARANYENCAEVPSSNPGTVRCPASGAERGALRLDQQERVTGIGSYARAEVEAPGRLFASAALRYDRIVFGVRDRFITTTNADDSGDRNLDALSPMFGLVWRGGALWSVYANLSTAFETPTITELTNEVSGDAGLNALLQPQRTRTAEVGVHGVLVSRVRVNATAFRAAVREELIPFDVPGQPGRRAFRNAGRTERTGIESSAHASLAMFDAGVSHTWSRFRFREFVVGSTDFAGNRIPGIPEHLAQAYLTVRQGGAFLSFDGVASSRVSANDAAGVFAAGYTTWNTRLGYRPITLGRTRFEPTASVENLFDRRYAGAVVINATRARFFEPGLPRRLSMVVRAYWY